MPARRQRYKGQDDCALAEGLRATLGFRAEDGRGKQALGYDGLGKEADAAKSDEECEPFSRGVRRSRR